MLRHYKYVCLLIEFTSDKPFILISASEITTDILLSSIISKMCLLILAFPNLKLLWSRSPMATTRIFKEIKRNFDDVDIVKALAAGTASEATLGEEEGYIETEKISNLHSLSCEEATKAAINMLKKMPGIDLNNVHKILSAINCVADLADMSEAQLVPLVGTINSKKLYMFLKSPFPS